MLELPTAHTHERGDKNLQLVERQFLTQAAVQAATKGVGMQARGVSQPSLRLERGIQAVLPVHVWGTGYCCVAVPQGRIRCVHQTWGTRNEHTSVTVQERTAGFNPGTLRWLLITRLYTLH